jgi:hypothetical protein
MGTPGTTTEGYDIHFIDLHGVPREIHTDCTSREAAQARVDRMADWQQAKLVVYYIHH